MSKFKKLKFKIRISKKIIFLSLGGIFLIALGWQLIRSKTATAAWFNDGWRYRKKITFTNSGSTVYNRKVKLDINTAALVDPNTVNFNTADLTFTPAIAKRNAGTGSSAPFAAGVMVGGKWSDSTLGDSVQFSRGNQISGLFYTNIDNNQGSIVFWITPEWNGNDGKQHSLFGNRLWIRKDADNKLIAAINNWPTYMYVSKDVSDWQAGNTYLVTFRWDMVNTIDGTNYLSLSVGDTHNFGSSSTGTIGGPDENLTIGSRSTSYANALIEGLTIYRRPLYDGQYGINVGNGDEIAQIFNNGAGQDPTLITGSWDVVFALPTNATTGALLSTGQAWSHPHSSNVLYTNTTNTGGFMMNGTYTNDGWSDYGTPTSVSALATSEKIYAGGYKFTTDAANEGIKYSKSGLTVGKDYVVRALAHSDGTSIPKIQIWDATNNHEITQMTATSSASTRTSPEVFLFTFELPYVSRYGGQPGYDWVTSDCTSIEVRLLNAASSGTVYWHQVEMLENLVDNPSLEVGSGDPWIPSGWSNAESPYTCAAGEASRETTNKWSGSSSLKLTVPSGTYQHRKIKLSGISKTSNKFYSTGVAMKVYRSAGDDHGDVIYGSEYTPAYCAQYKLTAQYQCSASIPAPTSWSYKHKVFRATDYTLAILPSVTTYSLGNYGYFDDLYSFLLSDVSLTVTPTSLANSTETTGIRVDGRDTATTPTSNLTTTQGTIKFQYTPRHSAADAVKFVESGLSGDKAYIAAFTTAAGSSGWHTSSNNQSTLTDSNKSWTTNQWVNYKIYNRTDGSSCTITANTATTVTCTLSGGTENDWDTNDIYEILPASDYILLYWSSANTMKLEYNMNGTSGSGTWNATGAIAAGTTYSMQIDYTGGGTMTLKVNGDTKITISSIPSAFGTAPTTAYWGSNAGGANQGDATFAQTPVTGVKMQSDCDDVRFTDANGNLLDYYYDSTNGVCNAESTDFYVLMPTINSGENVIYMYYGNPSASKGSKNSNFTQDTFTPSSTSLSPEENSPGPIAYWKFDEGTGTTADDSTTNGNNGTISGATWQTEDMCVAGKCLYFDGTNDVVTVSNSVSGIKTVSFWVKPITTSEQFIDLNGSAYIQSSSGTISATGFTNPTIYVNGKVSSTIEANKWQHVAITTDTSLTGSAIKIAQISSNYGQVFIDEVKLYSYARSASQIKQDYNAGKAKAATSKGTAINLSAPKDASAGLPSSLSEGLVGYWNFDVGTGTSAPDLSGNGNTANLGVGSSAPSWSAGKFGSGLDFEYDNQTYATLGTPSALNNLPQGNFTVSVWVKVESYPYATQPVLIGRGYNRWQLYFQYEGKPLLQVALSTTNAIARSDTVMSTNAWHHIVGVYDSNKKIAYLYQDGKEVSYTGTNGAHTTGSGTYPDDSSRQMNIGARSDFYSNSFFDGTIDEVRIYNRALSPAEVRALYEWAPGPVAHFKLDDGSGTSPIDSSGFGRTGSIINGIWSIGKYGKGLKLDGSGDYLEISDF